MLRNAVLALAAGLVLLGAEAARAGSYDVVSCKAPGGGDINRAWTLETFNSAGKTPPPLSAFKTYAGPERARRQNGIGFNSLAPLKQTVKQGDGAAWTFRAPAGTNVRRVQVWRFTGAATSTDDTTTPATEGGSWTVVAHVGSAPGGPAAIGGESCPGTTPTAPPYCRTGEAVFDATKSVVYDNLNEPVVSWGVECQGSTPTTLCFTSDGTSSLAGMELRGTVVSVEDRVPPEAAVTGALDGWQPASAARTAAATDSAGIRALRVLVDGVERSAQTFDCDFHLPAPCPTAPTLPLDLAGVADGRHTLTTIAEDTAGNVARSERVVDLDSTPPLVDRVPTSGRRISVLVSDALSGLQGGTIEVRDSKRKPFTALKTTLRGGRLRATVPRSVSLSRLGIRLSVSDKAGNAFASEVTSMSLSTRIGNRKSRKVRNERATVGYGRAVTVLGRLTTLEGSPLANQPIVVTGLERRTGATPTDLATAMTDTGGRFSIALPAGPARVLTVRYAGAPGLLHRARDVALRVPASSSIRASREALSGAGSVRFSGRLRALGAALPPGGKIVDLQAAQRGRWSTVATTRARGADGAWSAVARFRGTPGRYPVRLRIRREALFPYELGYSASVVVRVR